MSQKRDNRAVNAALDRLARAERGFLDREFLAPVLRGAGVQVRIAGVRCRLRVKPADFEGWGVFRPASHTLARLVRAATMGERRGYLGLFPALSLVLVKPGACGAAAGAPPVWLATPAGASDARFDIEGVVPVHMADDVDRFDTVRAWCSAFGKPLVCLIARGERVAGVRFEHGECEGVQLEAAEMFPGSVVVAVG